MTPAELLSRLDASEPILVLDVRSRFEFARGRVPGAHHIPFWTIPLHAAEIRESESIEIVVYCGHGPRARWAAWTMRLLGFPRASLLDGHWARWIREGRPREGAAPESDSR